MRKEIPAEVKEIMDGVPQWHFATASASGEPHVIPCTFKTILPTGDIAVACVFMDTTVQNVKANGRIAVAAHNPELMKGYRITGTAVYADEGPVYEGFAKTVNEKTGGRLSPKGVLVITPESIVFTGPGPENKKEI